MSTIDDSVYAFEAKANKLAETLCPAAFRNPFDRVLDKESAGEVYEAFLLSVGARYAGCTFTNYATYAETQSEVVCQLIRFAREMPERLAAGGGLILYGSQGTGKDHLLVAVLKVAILQHRFEAVWFDGADIYDQFYSALRGDDPDSIGRVQRELTAPHILAISDPQPPVGELSDSQLRRLRQVVDARYRAKKSTWLTTNIADREQSEGTFTAPIMGRLRENSLFIKCEWEGYREKRR